METAKSPAPAPDALRITRTLPAPRDKVFRAWTDPQAIVKWFSPTDRYVTRVPAFDLREGGIYRIEMELEGKVHTVAGVYREIRPPERLVFTWRWETEMKDGDGGGDGDSVVTLEFLDRGKATELRLTHEHFPSETVRDEHEKGWTGCLDGLHRFVRTRS